MNLIVAVDKNWGIGYKGNLLERIPEDMKFFRSKTINKVVVMGRTTLESFPNKKPLKNRVNIVLTRNKDFNRDDVIICNSIEELLKKLEQYNKDDVFIIGGESIYAQLLHYCEKAYITKINKEYKADTYMENLDKNKNWIKVSESEIKIYKDIEFKFVYYEKS